MSTPGWVLGRPDLDHFEAHYFLALLGHNQSHCGVFNQNKILFGRIGRFWLPWLPEFSSSIFNALFNQIQEVH